MRYSANIIDAESQLRYIAIITWVCDMTQKAADARRRLGHQIAQLREQRGWTLRDLSRRIGRDPARMSEIESGRANPSVDNLTDLGAAMDVEIVFVPRSRLSEVLDWTGSREFSVPVPAKLPSLLDEILVEGDDDPEDPFGPSFR